MLRNALSDLLLLMIVRVATASPFRESQFTRKVFSKSGEEARRSIFSFFSGRTSTGRDSCSRVSVPANTQSRYTDLPLCAVAVVNSKSVCPAGAAPPCVLAAIRTESNGRPIPVRSSFTGLPNPRHTLPWTRHFSPVVNFCFQLADRMPVGQGGG